MTAFNIYIHQLNLIEGLHIVLDSIKLRIPQLERKFFLILKSTTKSWGFTSSVAISQKSFLTKLTNIK